MARSSFSDSDVHHRCHSRTLSFYLFRGGFLSHFSRLNYNSPKPEESVLLHPFTMSSARSLASSLIRAPIKQLNRKRMNARRSIKMDMNRGRRLRDAGQLQHRRRRCQIFLACAFAVIAVVVYEPAFVGAAVVTGGESSSSSSSMLLRRTTTAASEEDEGANTHRRSLWLKEFLSNYWKKKPTPSPTSTLVIVSAPLTSQKPTSSKPTTSKPKTTSSPSYSVRLVTYLIRGNNTVLFSYIHLSHTPPLSFLSLSALSHLHIQ